MKYVAIIGTGFVADLYMKSFETFPDVTVKAVFDKDPARLEKFASHWSVPTAASLDDLLTQTEENDLILNLTNPDAHFEVSLASLQSGRHVYSEKPLAMTMQDARQLHEEANRRGLLISSAPCSVLSETAQTLWKAVRDKVVGEPLLVYAELDDGFISLAPYQSWASVSGAPWPYVDEFHVGCTVEHAGYYLTWLIAMFGSIKSVTASAAELDKAKLDGQPTGPDFSVAVLYFESGVVARLTCSIIAKHDHSIRIFGEKGTLEVHECWDNEAAVRFRGRRKIRRRLIEMPFARRIKPPKASHPKVDRTGAAAMNFALGPVEMLTALEEQRPCRISADFALHFTEVSLAIHNASDSAGAQTMTTRCDPMAPADWIDER